MSSAPPGADGGTIAGVLEEIAFPVAWRGTNGHICGALGPSMPCGGTGPGCRHSERNINKHMRRYAALAMAGKGMLYYEGQFKKVTGNAEIGPRLLC